MQEQWPADNITRRKVKSLIPYARNRICDTCGNAGVVRKDNKSTTCNSCAARKRGALGVAAIKARAKSATCENCGSQYGGNNKRFCSRKCRVAFTPKHDRKCKTCGAAFTILASCLKTNASGNFCSRPCYDTFLCRTERTTGRGSQWKKSRDEAIRKAPFCAICGTTKKLQVHHIIPFRVTFDNSQRNLIPLCVKHHRWVETILVGTEEFGFDGMAQMAWAGMLKERQMATAATLMEVRRAYV